MASDCKVHVLRLKPHQDLKKSILEFARANGIDAGIILTCVGSLEQFYLRFANQHAGHKQTGHFEIVSLTGTFSSTEMHLHAIVSDENGKVTGGHLLDENLIYTTAEIAIGELTDLTFKRVIDPTYGFKELIIKQRNT